MGAGTVSGSPLERLEQWRRVFPRATGAGSAWVHAPPLERLETGGLALLPFLFPSLPVVTNTITCNHKQNRNNTVDFRFLFHCFQICFSLLLLRICFTADQLLWVSSSSPLLRVDLWTALGEEGLLLAGRRRPWV
jgi:hypothetical protein